MLLSDHEICGLCVEPYELYYWGRSRMEYAAPEAPMIEPFSEAVSEGGVISYGLTSAGYDLRLGPELLHFPEKCSFTCSTCTMRGFCDKVADPKKFKEPGYSERFFRKEVVEEHSFVWIPPHQYVLGHSLEYLRIPRILKARCTGKSTLARAGILINTTPLEPGWEGHLTIEIGNITGCPAKVYAGEGIAQLEFELLSSPPQVDYSQKNGKYQGQRGVTPAIVR